ncbi:MAG: flavin reductase family protein [bacterium]
MEMFRPDELSGKQNYRMLTNIVVPRPIALVTSKSREGVLNCAPFSFYQGVCGSPPIISLSIARKKESLKDTFRNIMIDGEFVVHAPRKQQIEEVELASEEFPPDVSEVEKIGYSPEESHVVEVPGLTEPPIRLECRLHDQVPIAGGKVTVVFGEVVCFHLEDGLYNLDEDSMEFNQFNPLARLGWKDYTSLGESLSVKDVSSEAVSPS